MALLLNSIVDVGVDFNFFVRVVSLEEVQKAIKGGNDILIAIEQYHSDRADLLDRMGAHRSKAIASKIRSESRAFDEGTCLKIAGMERDGARQSALTQLQEYLEQLDQRHSNQLRYGTMELQSSCATLHQMLQTVFG